MKTYRVVLPMPAAAFLLAVLAAALLLAGCAPRTAPLRPVAAPKPTEGIVVYVSGGVQASSGGAWIDVEPGDAVSAGSIFRTDSEGYCELKFGETISVRIDPQTEFRCDSVALDANAAVRGGLSSGAILAKVKRRSGSDLQISTPSTVVGVRGTAFKVSVAANATKVTVSEGTVSVTQEGTTVDVDAGHSAEASLGAAVTEQPASPEELSSIDAYQPAAVDIADTGNLVKVVVVVEPRDAEIWLGTTLVGRGFYGAIYEEGITNTLYLKRDGFEEDVVYLPEKGGKPVRIEKKLKPLPGTEAAAEPAEPETAAEPSEAVAAEPVESPATEPGPATEPASTPVAESAPEATPSPAPESSSTAAEQPSRFLPAAGQNLVFRADPTIADDPFFQEMAALFSRQAPGFSLVASPPSANVERLAWPRGADLVGGTDNARQFTYERLPQLVAAKLVRPLEGWYDWARLAPVLVEAVRVGGKVYGVPIGGQTPVLYYNRSLVRQPPRAWSDITALAAARAQTGGDALAMSSLVPFFMGMFPESREVPLLIPDTTRSAMGTPRAAAVYDAMRGAIEESAMSIGMSEESAAAMFRDRKAAMLIHAPWAYGMLRESLGGSLGAAVLPQWGSPPVELAPYTNALALFVSSGVSDERAAVLKRFCAFLLERDNQLRLVDQRLDAGFPIAPALRFVGDDAALIEERPDVVSALYRQLATARQMPRGPLAGPAWRVFVEVLEGIRQQQGGEMLAQMADARFLLYGLELKGMPAGARELRAVVDPAEKSQGLFFRAWDGDSDLRLVAAGGSRGVVSVKTASRLAGGKELSYVYLILNYDAFRGGRAPALKGRIEYFDEPNAALLVVYDSKDTSVRVDPNAPKSWGAWKQAVSVLCEGSREWKTVDFPLPDARFDRRCNGADLRIEVTSQGRIPPIRSVTLVPAK